MPDIRDLIADQLIAAAEAFSRAHFHALCIGDERLAERIRELGRANADALVAASPPIAVPGTRLPQPKLEPAR